MKMIKDYSAYEIVMIVHELHKRGYEQLRLLPGMSPSGCSWRWMIYPKVLMKDNRFEHHGDFVPFECLNGSSGDSKPKEIHVEQFLQEHADFLELAKGEDKEYVKWFQTIDDHVQQGDFPIAFEEYFPFEQWGFLNSKEELTYPPF